MQAAQKVQSFLHLKSFLFNRINVLGPFRQTRADTHASMLGRDANMPSGHQHYVFFAALAAIKVALTW